MAKRAAFSGIMLAAAMIFSYVETLLVLPVPIPGIKLGLANLMIVLVLYEEGVSEAFLINFLRIVLTGLLFGNIQSVIFSLCGGLLSLAAMAAAKKTTIFGISGVSTLGGIFHMAGQLAAAVVVLGSSAVLCYTPFLVLSGALTGFFIGVLSGILLPKIPRLK